MSGPGHGQRVIARRSVRIFEDRYCHAEQDIRALARVLARAAGTHLADKPGEAAE